MAIEKTINRMNSHKNDDGFVGNPNGVDARSEGFEKLKLAIRERASALKPEEKRQIELRAVRYRMQEYLQGTNTLTISTGIFLKECLHATGVQLKTFANYINSDPGNVSKIIKGSRKISPETAIILGKTFETEPELWLQIQDKNEILELKQINKTHFQRFSLNKLMEVQIKASAK